VIENSTRKSDNSRDNVATEGREAGGAGADGGIVWGGFVMRGCCV
jgi:hypothetical protein